MKYHLELRVNGVAVLGRKPVCSSGGANVLSGKAILPLKKDDVLTMHVVVDSAAPGEEIKTLAEGCMINLKQVRLN